MKKKSIIFLCSLLFGQNYVFVHGLKSNSDTFFKMAGDFNTTTIKIGVAHFNQSGTCMMPDDKEVNCTDIASNNTLARAYGLGDNFDTKLYFKEFNSSDTNLSMEDAILYENQEFHSNSFIVNLSNNIDLSFEAQGKELQSVIESIKKATDDNNFVLVGHSMGGLAIRSYLQYYYNSRDVTINEAITIATPQRGVNYSPPASIYGASSENLKADSDDLLRLNATNLEVYDTIPFVAIVSSGYEKSIFEGDLISGDSDDGVVSVYSQKLPFKAKILNVTDGIYHTDETTNEKIINLVKKYSFEHKRVQTGWNLIGGDVEDFNLKSLQIAWHYNNGWSYYRKESLDYPKISYINGGFWAYVKKPKDFIFIENDNFEPLHSGWNMVKGPQKASDLNCSIIWKPDNDKWLAYPKYDGYGTFDTIGKHEGAWCLVDSKGEESE